MTVAEFMTRVDANERPWLRTYEGVDKGREPPKFLVKFPQFLGSYMERAPRKQLLCRLDVDRVTHVFVDYFKPKTIQL